MKKALLLFLISTVSVPAMAQSLSPGWSQSDPVAKQHAAFLRHLMHRQYAGAIVEKPTEIKQRVIAQATHYDFDVDSTTFRYSGTRGSAFDFNNLELTYRDYFDEWYYPSFIDLFYGPDASSMLADSIANYSDGDLYDLSYVTYRDDNQLDSITDNTYNSGLLSGSYLYLKNYNLEGHLTNVYELSLTLGGYDSLGKQQLYYNNDFSKVLADTVWHYDFGVFVPESSTQYYYGATGLLDSVMIYRSLNGSLVPNEQLVITYSGGQVSTLSTYDLSAMNPGTLMYRDSVGYEPGVNYYTFLQEEAWNMGSYEGGYQYRQHPNAAGVPDSLVVVSRDLVTDPWEAVGTLQYQYNSYNNPDSETITYADSSPSVSIKYYYEEYDDGDTTESIRPMSANKDFTIFPNPFSDRLRIHYTGEVAAQDVHIQLFNVLGQNIFETTMRIRKGSNTMMLPELLPGNYFFILKTDAGKIWSKALLKQ